MLATAAAVGAALVVVPSASAQGTDTTAPVLNAATLSPVSRCRSATATRPPRRRTSTGNNGWFTQAGADGAQRHRDR